MKNKLPLKMFVLLGLAFVNAAQAQDTSRSLPIGKEILQNADLSDGTNHWRGDVHLAASETSTDLTSSPNPTNGIAVELRSHGTTLWQEIKGFAISPGTSVDVTVDYSTSSDFALKLLHGGNDPDSTTVAREPILVTLSLSPSVSLAEHGGFSTPTTGFYCVPDAGAGTGTFQKNIPLRSTALTTPDSIWFKMWFPPGTGIIFFKSISVAMHEGPGEKYDGSKLLLVKPSQKATGSPENSSQTPGASAPTSPANNQ